MDLNARIEMARIRVENAKRAHIASLIQKQATMTHIKEVAEKMLELGVAPENAIAEITKLNHAFAEQHDVPMNLF